MPLTAILCSRAELLMPADAASSFERKRRADIMTRIASVDLLNRPLLSDFLPVQVLRAAAGPHVLSAFRRCATLSCASRGAAFSIYPRDKGISNETAGEG
jgi:2-polyprenyl-6-methoxyphenol hydroxylase-like FAD-dependent oxidoreductase